MGHKECFITRLWNRVFHKTKALPAPIQYTQKEVKMKMYQILQFLVDGIEIKKKSAESIDTSIKTTSVYFYEEGEEQIENEFNTYMHTVTSKKIRLNSDSKLLLDNPVTRSGILLEVYPVLNLAKVQRDRYYMNIYMNAVKIFARYNTKTKKISKNSTKTIMYNGVNSKEVMVYSGEIASIRNFKYYILDKSFCYIVAQILYEAIENRPFLYDINREEEKIIKLVRYYIQKSYRSYKEFIVDYLSCRGDLIEKKISDNTGIKSLKELEAKIRKSLEN